ncbi:MAG: hypothetical protein NT040_15460 [Bacteroidetes bacterium]|nr:hypothetical protein [Bacteroidota bacterium]
MRTLLITAFLILIIVPAFCEDFTITLDGRKLSSPLSRYYIADVFLGQKEDSCVGYVHPYGPNRINPVFFKRNIREEVKNFLLGSMPVQTGLNPLIVRVNRIYMYEVTKGTYEYTGIELGLSFICPRDSGLVEDFTSAVSLEIFQKNIPAGFGQVVAMAFDQCFSQYADRMEQGLTRPKVITTEQLGQNPINKHECLNCFSALKPRKGLYHSFFDFRDNTPDSTVDFKILHDYNTGQPLLSKAFLKFPKGYKPGEIWGFCEGDSVYFNNGRSFSALTLEGDLFVTFNRSSEFTRDVVSAAIFGGVFGGVIGASLLGGVAAVSSDPDLAAKFKLDLFAGKLLPYDEADYTRISSRVVLFLSRVSDPGVSLAVYVNGERQCEMLPGNYVTLGLSCHYPVARIRLVASSGGETAGDIPVELYKTEVLLLKVKKNHEVVISHLHDQMKKDLLKKRTIENTPCRAQL